MRTVPHALAALLTGAVASQAALITGVSEIRISRNAGGNDGWFYLEEVNIYNTAGTDVASLTEATGTPNFSPAFGSTATGAIDGTVANCCGTGTHGNNADSLGVGEYYSITLNVAQDIDAMNFPIEIYNRADGCCPWRTEFIDIQFLDAASNPITIIDQTGAPGTVYSLQGPLTFDSTFGPGGGAIAINGIPEPGAALLSLLGVLGLVGRRKR